MVRTVPFHSGIFLALFACAFATGCSDEPSRPSEFSNPETELTSGPAESDTTTFRVHFFWSGFDKDGEVVRFRFAVDADTSQPLPQWQATTAKDTTLEFPVDPVTAVSPHAFMIAAEDDDGLLDPTPARRIFASRTIPPSSCVTRGPASGSIVPTSFTFEWTGYDPDGGLDGGGAPVESFEFMLLRPGSSADGFHQPLPYLSESAYAALISSSIGDSLPAPYGDWKWTRVHGNSQNFESTSPGGYVFALRAIDEAGAVEQELDAPCNIRSFFVSGNVTGPVLTVCTSLIPDCLPPSQSATDIDRLPLEALEGESISFSWTASAESYGGTVVGTTYALDDTSSFPGLDPVQSAVTFTAEQLLVGFHFVYVRAVDDRGAVTNAVIPLQIIESEFRDPVQGRRILYVDDSTAPGVTNPADDPVTSIANFPNDIVETEWWMTQLLNQLGAPVTEWDALQAGFAEIQGRKPPPLRTLAKYSTVVWNVDFQNTLQSPTALWRAFHGDDTWALRNYLRAGGTLILTGFDVSTNTVTPASLFDFPMAGICASHGGDAEEAGVYVPKRFMGMDNAERNTDAQRIQGARDFIAANPAQGVTGIGIDSVRLDRGPTGSDAKWITNPPGDPNTTLSPGLPRVDGWTLADPFACISTPSIRREDIAAPIAEAILLYHGVNMGVAEDGGPSPREGLVTGIRVQSHSEGPSSGGAITPGNANGVVGRTVYFSFPFFWLRDEDAIQAMQAAFQYVNASPTLP